MQRMLDWLLISGVSLLPKNATRVWGLWSRLRGPDPLTP